jgi:hypothetical protein
MVWSGYRLVTWSVAVISFISAADLSLRSTSVAVSRSNSPYPEGGKMLQNVKIALSPVSVRGLYFWAVNMPDERVTLK